ncbi:MAG: AMP-binding protein [Sphingomonadaceae bacterium]|nr:AMP-binding protein [Sphingomonadaceae bacterium]
MRDTFVEDRLPPPELCPEFRFDLPELDYPRQMNAAVVLLDHAVEEGYGERPCVINDRGVWTYAEMRDLSDRIARVLVDEEGLIPGNRVVLRGPNGAWLFAAWAAVLKAGGVVVTTMPILRAGEIATLLRKAAISHAIVDQRCLEDFLAAAAQAGTVRSLLTYNGDLGGGALEARVAAATAPGFAPAETTRDTPAVIAFTSGTTGAPKGCVHPHLALLSPYHTFAANLLRPGRNDRHLCSAPIAFTFGLGALVLFPWASRGAAVTVEDGAPASLLDAIGRHRPTLLYTAPTAYKAMLGQLAGRDLSSLRTCVSAGEHLPAATSDAWAQATGMRPIDGIGGTELMHIFISAAGDDIRPGATGKAVPGFTATVLDDDGTPLPRGTGRLAIRGPVGCRYLDDAERQAGYVRHGWNMTGDTYRLDEDGYFWFVARSDDMIVTSGYNVAAPEVESALHAHPAVAECAVVGAPCPKRGKLIKAFVVLRDGYAPGDATARELQDHVKATIAPYKYPRAIEFVAELPRTPTGKLRRFALRG